MLARAKRVLQGHSLAEYNAEVWSKPEFKDSETHRKIIEGAQKGREVRAAKCADTEYRESSEYQTWASGLQDLAKRNRERFQQPGFKETDIGSRIMGGLDKTARNKRRKTSSKAKAFLQTRQVVDLLADAPEGLTQRCQKLQQQLKELQGVVAEGIDIPESLRRMFNSHCIFFDPKKSSNGLRWELDDGVENDTFPHHTHEHPAVFLDKCVGPADRSGLETGNTSPTCASEGYTDSRM